jgi:hypothetical protein
VGLPRKRGADTDQNCSEKAGKGAEYSPANRWSAARQLIVIKAGGARRRTERRLRIRRVARQLIVIEAGGARKRMERRLHVRHEGGHIAFVLVNQRRAMHVGALLKQLQGAAGFTLG